MAKLRDISGPHECPEGWELILTYSNGETGTRHYDSKRGANCALGRLRKRLAKEIAAAFDAADADVDEYDGTLQWFLNVLAMKTRMVAKGGGNEDRLDLKALASAAIAAKQLADTADIERRLEEAEKTIALINTREKHAIGHFGQVEKTGDPPKSCQPLH